ncbi:unnamed protein product [Staurois parvus]|uniref:Uncharacterized protein n=1 Tax=Staurois parvus TaxID=386267 RepID=A0ABN9CI81_9NEOB|nr:unnamed protein product [Staurois parvus]
MQVPGRPDIVNAGSGETRYSEWLAFPPGSTRVTGSNPNHWVREERI